MRNINHRTSAPRHCSEHFLFIAIVWNVEPDCQSFANFLLSSVMCRQILSNFVVAGYCDTIVCKLGPILLPGPGLCYYQSRDRGGPAVSSVISHNTSPIHSGGGADWWSFLQLSWCSSWYNVGGVDIIVTYRHTTVTLDKWWWQGSWGVHTYNINIPLCQAQVTYMISSSRYSWYLQQWQCNVDMIVPFRL